MAVSERFEFLYTIKVRSTKAPVTISDSGWNGVPPMAWEKFSLERRLQ